LAAPGPFEPRQHADEQALAQQVRDTEARGGAGKAGSEGNAYEPLSQPAKDNIAIPAAAAAPQSTQRM